MCCQSLRTPDLSLSTRLTQRWEASLWLSGRQMYLGGFQSERDAARAYDIAAIACKGLGALTNFGAASCKDDLHQLHNASEAYTTE